MRSVRRTTIAVLTAALLAACSSTSTGGSGSTSAPASAPAATMSSAPSSSTPGSAASSTGKSTTVSSSAASVTPTSPTSPADPGFLAAARQYCTQSGGTVQTRQPTAGTNNDQTAWIPLGEPVEVCRFQSDDQDASRIYVDLITLNSPQPTLAALAYLAKKQVSSTGGANPSAVLCTDLGGAGDYGPTAAGGGLVDKTDPVDVVVAACVFADQSFIDQWGITYYAGGVIRGTDLSKLFRFDVSKLPAVFPAQ